MKKRCMVFILVVAMIAGVFALSACGSKENEAVGSGGQQEDSESAEIVGETFDAGNVSVLCPDGWKAFPVSDIFAEEEDATDPNAISIYKGAKEELDMFSTPGIQINYYGEGTTMMELSKDFYENAADIQPLQLGGYTWEGFSGESTGIPLTVLWTEDGDDQFQVTVWTEMGKETISTDDVDVQAIIGSISAE